jgi:hypothetical protein
MNPVQRGAEDDLRLGTEQAMSSTVMEMEPLPQEQAGEERNVCWSCFWKNPPRPLRVVLVGLVLALPGALCGAMISLLVGEFTACSVAGTLVGATAGGVLEIWM